MPTMNPIKVRVTGEPDERIVRAYINGGLVVTAVENATGWGLCDEDWLPAPSEVMGGGLPGWTKYPGDDRFPDARHPTAGDRGSLRARLTQATVVAEEVQP